MSNSTDTVGCLSHRPKSHFFIMYEDFLDVAKISEHQYKLAAFWRVMETKTNDRITYNRQLIEECKRKGVKEPEVNLWVEIPYSEFVSRSLGTYKSSSFQIAAAESERLGFSKSRQLKRPANPDDPNSPMEDYKEYLFLTDVMQSVLNEGEYPTPIEINSPLLKSIAARKKAKKEKTAIEKNSTPIEINSTPTETPIEINSTPLLKSTGNKYMSKDDKDNQKDESMQTATATDTDSSIHSSSSLDKIIFSPEEEAIYALAKEKHISRLKRNKDHRDYCAKLASKEVATPERIESLMQHCWTRSYLKGKDLYLKNLITELDGWLQLQTQPATTKPSQDSPRVSDEVSDLNLEKLQARIAAKQAAKQKEGAIA